MEQVVAQLLTWGGPGLVIVVLLLVMREMHRQHRETQAQLIAEKDARIADAEQVRVEVVRVKDEAHKRDVELSGAVKSLIQAVDILADVTEKQRSAPMQGPRGRA